MTSQLVQVAHYFGESRTLLAFAVGESVDNMHAQVTETSRALHSSNILHRVQYTDDIESWIDRALFGYMADFEVAVVVRGVICASDLVRLVMQTVENNADMACSVDLTFAFNHRAVTPTSNVDYHSLKQINPDTLLRSSRFIQARCCDGSVKVIRLRSLHPARPVPYECSQVFNSQLQSILVRPKHLRQGQEYASKIMISPSVKSSSDPEDFRAAMQLGFMDLQGYDSSAIVWEDTSKRDVIV